MDVVKIISFKTEDAAAREDLPVRKIFATTGADAMVIAEGLFCTIYVLGEHAMEVATLFRDGRLRKNVERRWKTIDPPPLSAGDPHLNIEGFRADDSPNQIIGDLMEMFRSFEGVEAERMELCPNSQLVPTILTRAERAVA